MVVGTILITEAVMVVNDRPLAGAKSKFNFRFLLVLFMHCLVAVHSAACEYVIELHSAGNEERTGLAKLKISRDQAAKNPVTGQTFQGALHAIDSTFHGTASVAPEILLHLVTPDFFQQSLFDHIWKIYSPGQRGLQRTVTIKERYLAGKQDYTVTQHTKKKEGFFKKIRGYTKTHNSEVRKQLAAVIFDDYLEPSGKVTAFQEWLMNELGYEGENVVSLDSYLRQDAPRISEDWLTLESQFHQNRSEEEVAILTPFAHAPFSSIPLLDLDSSTEAVNEKNFLFPMDWQQACRSQGKVTDVSYMISGEALYVYEYRGASIKKKEEPLHLQRYDFIPAEGGIQLTIWGLPVEFVPWGWEYREKALPSRAVRYLRIIPVDSAVLTASQAARIPASSKKEETFKPSLSLRPLPKIPEEPLSSQVMSSKYPGTLVPNITFLFVYLMIEIVHCRTTNCQSEAANIIPQILVF